MTDRTCEKCAFFLCCEESYKPSVTSCSSFKELDENSILKREYEAKKDAGKPKLTLVPRKIIFAIAKVREYGNNKYPKGGKDNWKSVDPQRYRDAAYRHFMAYLDDPEGVDKESGLKHLDHLACNIAFLCEMEDEK